jgi:hypothetical protein
VSAEASTVLKAVVADFFFNHWCSEIPSDNSIQHIPSASIIMRKAFDWKHSRLSMVEVEDICQSYTPESRLVLFYI